MYLIIGTRLLVQNDHYTMLQHHVLLKSTAVIDPTVFTVMVVGRTPTAQAEKAQ